ncbi:hypothetical protein PPYR_07123 [Photinus pyralis]|uniref:Uncharacterized protein n=1 Tax=Photinus pyralis TaxID=7054 RepID=A0A1Y1LIL1_PHOPY|nr:hypothetical protein PPYR_07123 [Photinus pyralis]
MLLGVSGIRLLSRVRCFSTSKLRLDTVAVYETEKSQKKSSTPLSSNAPTHDDVAGLSDAVFKHGNDPVGSGASKSGNYKNPEYFSYHQLSYYEAEIEMAKYRLPQPSSHPN